MSVSFDSPSDIPVLDGSLFAWCRGGGYAELSELEGALFGHVPRPRRFALLMVPIYRDALDLGFRVRSPKTGTVLLFRLIERVLDAEGDVEGWRLADDRDGTITLTIWND